ERFREVDAGSWIVLTLCHGESQLVLGVGVAFELAEQLAIILPHARPVGIELQRPGERLRGHRQAAVTIGHRRQGPERERVAGIELRDLLYLVERSRKRGA